LKPLDFLRERILKRKRLSDFERGTLGDQEGTEKVTRGLEHSYLETFDNSLD